MKKLMVKALIQLLLTIITRQRAEQINAEVIRFLRELANRTKTEADDELVRTLRHFLRTRDNNGHHSI